MNWFVLLLVVQLMRVHLNSSTVGWLVHLSSACAYFKLTYFNTRHHAKIPTYGHGMTRELNGWLGHATKTERPTLMCGLCGIGLFCNLY